MVSVELMLCTVGEGSWLTPLIRSDQPVVGNQEEKEEVVVEEEEADPRFSTAMSSTRTARIAPTPSPERPRA